MRSFFISIHAIKTLSFSSSRGTFDAKVASSQKTHFQNKKNAFEKVLDNDRLQNPAAKNANHMGLKIQYKEEKSITMAYFESNIEI